MDRSYKTSKSNRSTYIYYQQVDGSDCDIKIELKPGEERITETMIEILHKMDDEEFDNNRRADNHRTGHLSVSDESDMVNPIELIPAETICVDDLIDLELRNSALKKAIADLDQNQQLLIRQIYFEGRKAADIAAERGVSKAAVSQQLKRIYQQLQKYLRSRG